MTRREFATIRSQGAPNTDVHTDGRRRQLRLMILSAADAARNSRRVTTVVQLAVSQGGRAIRDRVATLLRAAS